MTDPVKPPRYPKTAPPDTEAEHVYTQIMLRAEAAGLIVQAYGGVATLAIPSEQRKVGIRGRVLEAVQMNEAGGPCESTLGITPCALPAGHDGAHQDQGGRRRWN